MSKERSSRDWRWQLIILGALLVLAYIGIVIADWDDSQSQVSNGGTEVATDPESAPTPFLFHEYETGVIYVSGRTQSLYRDPPPKYTGEFDIRSSGFHIHGEDMVKIMGTSQLRTESIGEQWYWPVCVLQGGLYPEVDHPDDCASEENWYWVSDYDARLFGPTTLGERPVPPFSVGEEVRVSYNFCVRVAPAGPTNGNSCPIVYGGTDVTIIGGPTLADGRYWCEIRKENGITGWVSCEFAKK